MAFSFARIVSGKFRGVRGHVKSSGEGYYEMYPSYKKTRKGDVSLRDSGLGMIVNIKKSNLKKVKY